MRFVPENCLENTVLPACLSVPENYLENTVLPVCLSSKLLHVFLKGEKRVMRAQSKEEILR